MKSERIFLDTRVLFSAVLSETGGSRQLLKLGEAGVSALWVGPSVISGMDVVLECKSPTSKGLLALLLDRAGIQIGPAADPSDQARALTVVTYAPDALVVAEALTAQVNYLVSLDRQHLVGNPQAETLPFPVGTPGDCLSWLRSRL